MARENIVPDTSESFHFHHHNPSYKIVKNQIYTPLNRRNQLIVKRIY